MCIRDSRLTGRFRAFDAQHLKSLEEEPSFLRGVTLARRCFSAPPFKGDSTSLDDPNLATVDRERDRSDEDATEKDLLTLCRNVEIDHTYTDHCDNKRAD